MPIIRPYQHQTNIEPAEQDHLVLGPAQTEEEWNEKGRAMVDWTIKMVAALVEENNERIMRDLDDMAARPTLLP